MSPPPQVLQGPVTSWTPATRGSRVNERWVYSTVHSITVLEVLTYTWRETEREHRNVLCCICRQSEGSIPPPPKYTQTHTPVFVLLYVVAVGTKNLGESNAALEMLLREVHYLYYSVSVGVYFT